MGEIADMMLDGTMCEGCGEFMNIGGEPAGYPVRCAACGEEPDDSEPVNYVRFNCDICRRPFKTEVSRDQHRRDKHG